MTYNSNSTRYIHDSLNVGDRVDVFGPLGDFYFVQGLADRITLIAGGIGYVKNY
jgi:ferredoxin-NADP reductase